MVSDTPDPDTFAIFDTFPDDSRKAAHLSGKVAAALMAQASNMLAHPPVIEKIDVLVVKIPDRIRQQVNQTTTSPQ